MAQATRRFYRLRKHGICSTIIRAENERHISMAHTFASIVLVLRLGLRAGLCVELGECVLHVSHAVFNMRMAQLKSNTVHTCTTGFFSTFDNVLDFVEPRVVLATIRRSLRCIASSSARVITLLSFPEPSMMVYCIGLRSPCPSCLRGDSCCSESDLVAAIVSCTTSRWALYTRA